MSRKAPSYDVIRLREVTIPRANRLLADVAFALNHLKRAEKKAPGREAPQTVKTAIRHAIGKLEIAADGLRAVTRGER